MSISRFARDCERESEFLDELKRQMRYEPETGLFIRILDHKKCKAGERAGSLHGDGRIFIGLLGERFAAHRLAVLWMTGHFPEDEVDHINCDHSDNRWENLRECSSSENKWNRRADRNRGTGTKGVRLRRRTGKYEASFRMHRVEYYVGTFDTLAEASMAVASARKERHGEFARA